MINNTQNLIWVFFCSLPLVNKARTHTSACKPLFSNKANFSQRISCAVCSVSLSLFFNSMKPKSRPWKMCSSFINTKIEIDEENSHKENTRIVRRRRKNCFSKKNCKQKFIISFLLWKNINMSCQQFSIHHAQTVDELSENMCIIRNEHFEGVKKKFKSLSFPFHALKSKL